MFFQNNYQLPIGMVVLVLNSHLNPSWLNMEQT